MKREHAVRIELFREKLQKLRGTRVWKAIDAGEVSFSIRADAGGELKLSATGPGEEALEAFILTLRFFLQDNKRISIKRMGEMVQGLPIDAETKARLDRGRSTLNQALDRPCEFEINGVRPTYRDLVWGFVYGEYADAHPHWRSFSSEWTSHPVVEGFASRAFYNALVPILRYLVFLDGSLPRVPDADD